MKTLTLASGFRVLCTFVVAAICLLLYLSFSPSQATSQTNAGSPVVQLTASPTCTATPSLDRWSFLPAVMGGGVLENPTATPTPIITVTFSIGSRF